MYEHVFFVSESWMGNCTLDTKLKKVFDFSIYVAYNTMSFAFMLVLSEC